MLAQPDQLAGARFSTRFFSGFFTRRASNFAAGWTGGAAAWAVNTLVAGAISIASMAPPPLTAGAAETAAAASSRFFRSNQGVATEDQRPLPDDLGREGVRLWRVPLGPGHSTPCVAGDAIYLTTFEDEKLTTVAIDRATGRQKWRQVAPATRLEAFHPTGSPAAATVASDGQRVYSFFGSYGLLCYDTAGKLLWSKPIGPFQDEFGSASSPVLAGDRLLLNEDHDVNSF
ncbi:MAG: PQQ-binding-like beta-propeller repeat protein, partial [Planctomycetota bacterium]